MTGPKGARGDDRLPLDPRWQEMELPFDNPPAASLSTHRPMEVVSWRVFPNWPDFPKMHVYGRMPVAASETCDQGVVWAPIRTGRQSRPAPAPTSAGRVRATPSEGEDSTGAAKPSTST